jgi:hypothetical protein
MSLRVCRSAASTGKSYITRSTPVMPFIILSLPPSEHRVEDLLPPVSLDKHLFSPNDTFRSYGMPHMISDDTRPVLAPLHEIRKRSLPSQIVQLFVLATACSVFLSNSDFVTFICTMIIGKSVSGSMTVAPLLLRLREVGEVRGGA